MEICMEELQNKFRYEKKFILNRTVNHKFIHFLYKNNFQKLYNDRIINNIYLDDINKQKVTENIDGLSRRKKIRIRWYGDKFLESEKNLEIKIKEEFLNKKKIIYLGKHILESQNKIPSFIGKIKKNLNNCNKKEYLEYRIDSMQPTLLNNYLRSYYTDKNNEFRITVDDMIKYYSPLTKNVFNETSIVIEIKHNSKIIYNSYDFPFLRLTRYSKYVKGYLSTSHYKPFY